MRYQDINAQTIDRWVGEGWEWGIPIDRETFARAAAGDWQLYLTPTKPVPRAWLGDVRGRRVLGLASGGGQQMPVLSAAGAVCTVLDYSPRQLESERAVAAREGYAIDIVRADMTEPLPFADASFDIIVHPVSNCYVREVRPIFRECFRVLRPGGVLLAGLDNGINYIFDDDEATLRFSLPFDPLVNEEQRRFLEAEDCGMQFSHTMEEQLGGQLEAGFILTALFEDTNGTGNLHEHNIPSFVATRAVKPNRNGGGVLPMSAVRERTESLERHTLAPAAAKSDASRGRRRPEEPDALRTCYQRDRDRILHCKAFRRLKQKTQVFLSPEGDHYRTRLTHTLEVSQIARTIARALRLNEDLTEAIALGHDLGHTPFGHAGERALDRLCPGGFTHYRQSLRVVDKLEHDGAGLNLTWEVRNGIVTHTCGAWARTAEGQTVRRADHIAFLNHDIEDAITAGVLREEQLPIDAVSVLGHTKSQRITTMITDLVEHSRLAPGTEPMLRFSPRVEAAYNILKDFMYATVYVDKEAKREEKKVDQLVASLYGRLCADPNLMPNFYMQVAYQEGVERAVADYISGMSDEYATRLFEDWFVPKKWHVL